MCIVIAERVRVDDKVPERDWDPLMAAGDAVVALHNQQHYGGVPYSRKSRFEPALFDSKKSAPWAQQLHDGLVAVGRWDSPIEIDDNYHNFGLTYGGDAVWVDFGV